MIKFPKNFLWGAATSSYQVEGGNSNADWWPWELKVGHAPSAAACGHYERYAQDFDLAKQLNHNAHRMSVEWARIEPREGEFSQTELQHYVDVLKALKARGIEPMVTLHHFTNPIWFAQEGAWTKKTSVAKFARYSEAVVRVLAPYVRYWITINEPTIYLSHAYMFGWWPPQLKSNWKAKLVRDHMVQGHIKVYPIIHKIYKEMGLPAPMVSISHHIAAVVPCTNSLRDKWAVRLRDKFFNFEILDELAKHKTLDFIGLNYYSRHLVHLRGWLPGNFIWDVCNQGHHPLTKNSLGWDIYPDGLRQVLLKLKRYDVPTIITENGICTLDDDQRWAFIAAHLKSIHEAMEQGANVGGYLHWSLLDNFEWDKGFVPRFGLIHVDYATQQRTIKPSALKLAQVYKSGVLE